MISSEPGDPAVGPEHQSPQERAVEAYWVAARERARLDPLAGLDGTEARTAVTPPAWSFGVGPKQADALLALVLAGTKSATSSAAAAFDAEEEAIPAPGDLSIILDGSGRPGR